MKYLKILGKFSSNKLTNTVQSRVFLYKNLSTWQGISVKRYVDLWNTLLCRVAKTPKELAWDRIDKTLWFDLAALKASSFFAFCMRNNISTVLKVTAEMLCNAREKIQITLWGTFAVNMLVITSVKHNQWYDTSIQRSNNIQQLF